VRQFATGEPEAVVRVHAQLPAPTFLYRCETHCLCSRGNITSRAGRIFRAAVRREEGTGLEWAAAEAKRAIHDNSGERLGQLIREYPALLSWRNNTGESLLASLSS
jgi:hypothetical protein